MEALNKHNIRRILYLGFYDVMIPEGPEINEFEFTRVLSKHYGKDAWCVMLKPSGSVEHLDQVNTVFYSRPHPLNPLSIVFKSIYLFVRLAWIVRRHRIDLVVARIWYMPLFLVLLWVFCRVPFAIKGANVPGGVRRRNLLTRLYWSIDDVMHKFLLRRAIAVDIVSPVDLKRLLRVTPQERVAVIANATNTEAFRPFDNSVIKADLGIRGKWPVLGYLGGFPTERGARQLLETAKRLLPDYPDLHILVVGWDPKVHEVEAEARAMGLESKVSFLGWQPYARVPELINALDIGFAFDDAQRALVIGNSYQKIRQYLACGRPVVTLPIDAEFIRENDLGGLAEPDDYDAIAEVTRTWIGRLQNEPEATRDRVRAYAVAHFSMDQALQVRLDLWARSFPADFPGSSKPA